MNYILQDVSTQTRVVCIGDSKTRKNTLTFWNKDKDPYAKWTAVSIGNNKFTRQVGEIKFHIGKGNVIFSENLYNFPDKIKCYTEKKHNTKIVLLIQLWKRT